jgi:2-polyprenyl-6-hydroxyphenyl methylase/3-demethylubiquinone-9 3-methyltransferase
MKDDRFKFGKNWSRFLKGLNQNRIDTAKISLQDMLNMENLNGLQFLDIGSGSGLFSLAARFMGASVYSFDYDRESVNCTEELKKRFFDNDEHWQIGGGSILDREFTGSLGRFDIVYSWGVLHHTGNMVEAMENTIKLVKPKGKLFISIYNDQGWISRYWRTVKILYNSNSLIRFMIIIFHIPWLFCLRLLVRMLSGRLSMSRGMSLWHDMIDWLGGYPFEVARPERIVEFYHDRGFFLTKMKTCGGKQGCNEFVFEYGNPRE